MAEETITFNIVYDVQGMDQSIRSSQRLLYFMNATRLAVTDIQRVMAQPTITNIMWTSIQLTRVWTTLIRYIKQANAAAAGGNALSFMGLGGYGAGRAARATGGGGITAEQTVWGAGGTFGLPQKTGLMSTITALAAGIGPPGWIAIGAAAATIGVVAWDIHQRQVHTDWQQRQRDAAKNQGFEY